jgi:hypothetical protein
MLRRNRVFGRKSLKSMLRCWIHIPKFRMKLLLRSQTLSGATRFFTAFGLVRLLFNPKDKTIHFSESQDLPDYILLRPIK